MFVHSKIAELQFVAEAHGVKRFPVMYDDYVLVGPKSDPVGIKGMTDVAMALTAIKDKKATFISRGDRRAPTSPNSPSGTRTPVSTFRKTRVLGTNRSAKAWPQHSTWRMKLVGTHFQTAALGFL